MDRRTLYTVPTHRLRLTSIQILSSRVGHARGTPFPKLRIASLNPRGPSNLIYKIVTFLREPDTYRSVMALTVSRVFPTPRPSTRVGLAATMASPILYLLQIRVDSDTPSFAAITCVAPAVRFSDLAIFVTPALALAIAFICRTLWDRPCTMRLRVGNRAGTSL
jgi:hypothetical protein